MKKYMVNVYILFMSVYIFIEIKKLPENDEEGSNFQQMYWGNGTGLIKKKINQKISSSFEGNLNHFFHPGQQEKLDKNYKKKGD